MSASLCRMPKRATMLAEDLLRPSNVHVLRGLVQLGRLRAANTDMKGCMKAVHVFHTYVFVALHSVLVSVSTWKRTISVITCIAPVGICNAAIDDKL